MIDLASIVVREHPTGSYSVRVWHGDHIVFEGWRYASPESAFEQGHVALRAFRKAAEQRKQAAEQAARLADREYWEAIALDEQAAPSAS